MTDLLVAPSLARRMASWLYEGLLMFGVVFVAGYLFSTLSQTRNAMENRHPQQAFLFVVFGIYFTWFWSKGQTLAMKTWKIRLVDAQGAQVTQTRAFARYLFSWAWFLPPLLLGWVWGMGPLTVTALGAIWVLAWASLSQLHPHKQFWHDTWAGTRLVSSERIN